MSDQSKHPTQSANTQALERASGRSWADWVVLFEKHDAAGLSHKEIALIAEQAMPVGLENPGWWAQTAAVAYEQHAGIRLPGQVADGTFQMSVSRTIHHGREQTFELVSTSLAARTDQMGHQVSNQRISQTPKRLYWRASLDGAGAIECAVESSGEMKSAVTLQHTGLMSPEEVARWRAHWKTLLAEIG